MDNQIVFDFTNVTESAVGEHGISDSLLNSLKKKAGTVHTDILRRRQSGRLPFMDLPYAGIIDYAKGVAGRYENFINVGIGGSALGAQALVGALCHPFHNVFPGRAESGMRMFFADNIDPDFLNGMFDVCDPRKTLYNIITKSGSTAETMGTFLLVKELLEKDVGNSWRDHVVITTDPHKGDLRKIAETEKILTFPVPEGVGGRFSVLTPVGLLPAACAGIDVRELLDGAAAMDRRLGDSAVIDNPAYLYALYLYLLDLEKEKRMSVMMPYSSRLYSLADWYRQLWAESLGKKKDLAGKDVFVGQTPIKALGVTDQHSQVQLYVEGPFDKVFTIIRVEHFDHELLMKPAYKGYSSLDYLGGRTMAELIEAERQGTVYALTKNKRPNLTITFPKITPHTVGQFMYALEMATVFSGGLYNIDPLDQPGVEEGKRAAFALMGRPGYEEKARDIRSGLASSERYVK
ncbi:MAG: glucose-6-phosphate isomerase [Candidatus Latescibacter sp.]|nr:glucose-6-phosphate isomerase [Candidatus Latescibacter sp.]